MRGEIPYYGASGIVDYVNQHLFDEELVLLAEDGENIVSRATPIAFRITGKSWVNNHAHVLRPKSLDPRFLVAYLESLDYRPYNSGTAQPKLNRQACAALEVPLPSREEQGEIAAVIEDVERFCDNFDALIFKKQYLKQAAIQELLSGRMRLHAFRGEWRTQPLGSMFNFSGGYSASRAQLSETGIAYLHYGDIHLSAKSHIDVQGEWRQLPKLSIAAADIPRKSLLEDGDVVFVDASEDDEGTSKYVVVDNPERIPYISGLHTIVAKSKDARLDNMFKRYCFQSWKVKEQFRFFAVGTKVSGISKANIKKITLHYPEAVDEQHAIAEVLCNMDAEIAELELCREKAAALKQGMLQQLLTGRIRLV